MKQRKPGNGYFETKRMGEAMRPFLLTAAIILLTTTVNAQFNEYLFTSHTNVYCRLLSQFQALGDQNGDGYDDFFIYDYDTKVGSIYFGGNPVDTLPAQSVNFHQYYGPPEGEDYYFLTVDANGDGIKDLIINEGLIGPDHTARQKFRILYGGEDIDFQPDLVFFDLPGYYLSPQTTTLDFNGDGHDELVHVYLHKILAPDSVQTGGYFFFYNTYPELDTIPFKIITGDTTCKNYYSQIWTSGDISGDGKDDIFLLEYTFDTLYTTDSVRYIEQYYNIHLMLGNDDFDFTPSYTISQKSSPIVINMEIVDDMNGDGIDDLIMPDYLGYYPGMTNYAVYYGGLPFDTIPDRGLTTGIDGIMRLWTVSGDFNNDGFNDILCRMGVQGYERLDLWLGGTDTAFPDRMFGSVYDNVLMRCYKVGDVNGDGIEDMAMSMKQRNTGEKWLNIISGDTSVVGIKDENATEIPSDFELLDAYPNPFNPSTTITYKLPVVSDVRIEIVDINGELITTYENAGLSPGTHEYQWNGTDTSGSPAASGVYFCRITANGTDGSTFTDTVKLVLMK